ncbi:MAG TPA: methyltransferase domain-containing protein [Roseiflexaceae bacterium]|nr:methyltransferase domain-containing protein [Roseiflexaceae bacterium]
MPLWPDLRVRATAPELMDDLALGGEELTGALRELRLINRLLGASRPTVEGVARLWRAAGRPLRLSLLDVGAGSGDASRALLHWARRHGVQLDITLLDLNPQTCAEAARCFAGEPRVQVRQGDMFELAADSADIITATLVLHHIPEARLGAALRALVRAARLGVVANDLRRSLLAWAGIRAATAALSRNRMIRHDAPLSVARGFRAADLERLRAEPGVGRMWYVRRRWFRWLVVIEGLKARG